jgi:aspartyl-tRNA(Asn)/glutamyl-tRNA(Gln) amidotransferase subunit B
MEKSVRDKYTVVIGLEVHAQLLTKSKIFTTDSTEYGRAPNTSVNVVTLAHPGTLPRLNKRAAEYAMKMGLACHSEISRFQIFDRKNYFYPDLPKGYQITQHRTPICQGGYVTIPVKGGERNIGLNRIHIEEDAGKSIHLTEETDTLVDFNRAGVPLIEIVTDPEIKSSDEAYAFLTEIRKLVRYLDICDGNMEEGSLRCDANISIMLNGAAEFGKKVEVKNMNSIHNVQHAIEFEIERQIEELENGKAVVSETRTFDANTRSTHSMRTKEELNDYRYFPDPDLSPLEVSDSWLSQIKSSMPALPRELHDKYIAEFHLSEYDAHVLTDSKDVALYFEAVCKHTKNFKSASNWVMGPIKAYLNDLNLPADEFPVPPNVIAELISLIDEGKLNFSVASRQLFPELLRNPDKSAGEVAQRLNLIQDSSMESILPIVNQIIKEFPLKVEEYHHGKKGIMAMFMGEVMKRSKGKADPKVATELLKKKLEHV